MINVHCVSGETSATQSTFETESTSGATTSVAIETTSLPITTGK